MDVSQYATQILWLTITCYSETWIVYFDDTTPG